jgi:hypothetical protein
MGSAPVMVAIDEDVVDAADDDFDEATSLRDSDARTNDDDDDDEDDDDDAAGDDDDDSTALRSKRRSTASDKLEALPTLALPLLLLLPPLAPELVPDSATAAGAGIGSMARGCLALPAKHS